MAFTEYFHGPHRWNHFNFKASGSAVLSFINETVSIGKKWQLHEVRLHFSTAMGSVKYMTMQISGSDSSYNTKLYSESLNGIQDLHIIYSSPLIFMSDQTLIIATSVLSVANQYGLEVIGWSVID